MAELTKDRIVQVSIDRQTYYPTEIGFGTQLILTNETSGPLDASTRTKLYSGVDEVAVDWPVSSEAYKAANAAFSARPGSASLKIGYYDALNSIDSELTLVEAYDNDWYGLTFTSAARDGGVDASLAASWVEARTKVCVMCSNDVLTKDAADTTCVAAQLKAAGYDRTAIFYHETPTDYPDVEWLSRMLSVDYNKAGSSTTGKFKRLPGITSNTQLSSADVTAVTGWSPGLGFVSSAGHYANTYVTIGGLSFVVEGNMVSGEFFDTIHFVDWLASRVQNEVLGELVNSPKIPYTNVGVQKLVQRVQFSLQRGELAGGIASDEDPETGEILAAYTVQVERVEDVPASQRAQRIAPDIQFTARLAGAVHYASVSGVVTV